MNCRLNNYAYIHFLWKQQCDSTVNAWLLNVLIQIQMKQWTNQSAHKHTILGFLTVNKSSLSSCVIKLLVIVIAPEKLDVIIENDDLLMNSFEKSGLRDLLSNLY